MKKAIGIVILCASAAFAGTSIDPMDPNITNLAFCITNNASASIAPSHSTSADSNISLLSEDLIRDGFTIAATNFAWISSSTTNSLDIVAWRNVGNINTVYLITCRHHSAHTNEVRTVLLRDAEFGNTVATALNENFHWGNRSYFQHILTFEQPPKYQRGDHYGVAISSNVFYATGSFTQISHKILRNSNEQATPFGKRMLNR